MKSSEKIAKILDFWFVECHPSQWFKKDEKFDKLLASLFKVDVEKALIGALSHWTNSEEGIQALILLLDQFTRNIFRNQPRSFSGDPVALSLSFLTVQRNFLMKSNNERCHFMLMPMMHQEDLVVQNQSLPLFKKFTSKKAHQAAIKHRNVIKIFGRFPHRNSILGRISTDKELEFLKKPGAKF